MLISTGGSIYFDAKLRTNLLKIISTCIYYYFLKLSLNGLVCKTSENGETGDNKVPQPEMMCFKNFLYLDNKTSLKNHVKNLQLGIFYPLSFDPPTDRFNSELTTDIRFHLHSSFLQNVELFLYGSFY